MSNDRSKVDASRGGEGYIGDGGDRSEASSAPVSRDGLDGGRFRGEQGMAASTRRAVVVQTTKRPDDLARLNSRGHTAPARAAGGVLPTLLSWILFVLLVGYVLVLMVCAWPEFQEQHRALSDKVRVLEGNRSNFAYVAVLLDRTKSVGAEGDSQALFRAYLEAIPAHLLPQLGGGDKLVVYFIDERCGFENYLVMADEVPGFSDESELMGVLADLRETPSAVGRPRVGGVLRGAVVAGERAAQVVDGIGKKISQAKINAKGRSTDLWCALDEVSRMSPPPGTEAWLYILSDLLTSGGTLDEEARSALAQGGWKVVVVSNLGSGEGSRGPRHAGATTEQQAARRSQTIGAIRDEIFAGGWVKEISISDFKEYVPGHSPIAGLADLAGHRTPGLFLELPLGCLRRLWTNIEEVWGSGAGTGVSEMRTRVP